VSTRPPRTRLGTRSRDTAPKGTAAGFAGRLLPTGRQQPRSAGANIAPINWVLGALGIILGLSLVETLLVLVIGNLVGCALFGLFCIMGSRNGLESTTSGRTPSAASCLPSARAVSRPSGVSARSSSGSPEAAFACRTM
jgi:permease for cytosine/purines